jgi:acetyltransferase-like isoleucine patch superfamily enzyme
MGKGCTLGPGSFVHYGVTLGDHVVIEADSFVMKGEALDAHTVWRGNPATLYRRNLAAGGAVPPKTIAEPYPYDIAAE